MVLMVFLSSRISPFTSTVILRDKSPRATAVVTSAMLRTCAVRFPAMAFTESVRSFHVPATPGTIAWPPSLPSVPTSRATRVTSSAHVHSDFAREVAARHRRGHLGNVAHLPGQVAGHRVHRVGEILPRSGDAGDLCLAAQFSVRADFTRDARYLSREHAKLLNHGVYDGGRTQEFAFEWPSINVQLYGLRQIAFRHGRDSARDFRRWAQQIIDERVDRYFHLSPRRLGQVKSHALSRAALFTHHLPDAFQFLRHLLVGSHDVVERVGDFSGQPGPVTRQPHREVAVAHGLEAGEDYAQIG